MGRDPDNFTLPNYMTEWGNFINNCLSIVCIHQGVPVKQKKKCQVVILPDTSQVFFGTFNPTGPGHRNRFRHPVVWLSERLGWHSDRLRSGSDPL
jgi:hypothetical protein